MENEVDLRQISDDFFEIGKIGILQRKTGNQTYDFDFRRYYECRTVFSGTEDPVLLHIGAVEDYMAVQTMIEDMGMQMLVSTEEHLRCSTIEKWYPLIRDITPRTRVYNELPSLNELKKIFTFPIFVKGNRQTNRHKRAQCIIDNEQAYRKLQSEWKTDPVLFWQKAAIREYVQLKILDAASYPDFMPISYEFRFFYVGRECVGYVAYWTFGPAYYLTEEEFKRAKKLTDLAAERLEVPFAAVDAAMTKGGDWIIIEVNDAQESGFASINPLMLWRNAIRALQK